MIRGTDGSGDSCSGIPDNDKRPCAARRPALFIYSYTPVGGTSRWVYWLLQGACAYVFFCELSGIPDVLMHRAELAQLVPGGYGARLAMRPFVASTLVALGWFRFFRTERDGARVWALAAAVVLLLYSVAMWLNASVNELHFPPWLTFGYPLAAIALLVYVVRGRERGA